MPGRVRVHYSIPSIGTCGLELVKEESLDLVLLKPDFPDKTLIEVIRELRELSDVPLIVLTHQTYDLEPVIALEAGADGYIQLSWELSELAFNVWSLIHRLTKRFGRAKTIAYIGGISTDLPTAKNNGGPVP